MSKSYIAHIKLILLLASALSATPAFAQSEKEARATLNRVQNIFETTYDDVCASLRPGGGETVAPPEVYQLTFNYSDEDHPPRPYTVYEFLCFVGAYNEGFVYFGADEYLEITHLSFAQPTFDIIRENDDYESAVIDIVVTGFEAADEIINADFNLETKTIYSYSRWRGIGDAYSTGKWQFQDGNFVLKTYDVDASYDGERSAQRIYGEGKVSDFN